MLIAASYLQPRFDPPFFMDLPPLPFGFIGGIGIPFGNIGGFTAIIP